MQINKKQKSRVDGKSINQKYFKKELFVIDWGCSSVLDCLSYHVQGPWFSHYHRPKKERMKNKKNKGKEI